MPHSTMKTLIFLTTFIALVDCHGRLREPPGRSSAWRYGFDTPQNFDDTELFCGGYTAQHEENGGKCGICGDNWRDPKPRPNELGGIYAPGVITRTYKRGQVIDTHIQLTQNHMGWYELRLCALKNDGKDATQECLNQHILQRADGKGNRIPIPKDRNDYKIKMKLPDDVTCKHCVLQWDWVTGNRWDFCSPSDDKGALGCGPQETFRSCADIRITK